MRRAAYGAAQEAKQKLEDTKAQHKVEIEQIKAKLRASAARMDQLRLAKVDLDAAVEGKPLQL